MKICKGIMVTSMAVLPLLFITNSIVHATDTGIYGTSGIVQFEAGNDPTLPVDPENPDPTNPVTPGSSDPEVPVTPGTPGPLSIDYVSHLNFGRNEITNKDITYYANAQSFVAGEIAGQYRGNYIQVTDKRGTLAGWTLTVKQNGQFTSKEAKKSKELIGAEIKLTQSEAASINETSDTPVVMDAVLNPSGSEAVIMSAKDGEGDLTWVDRFGHSEKVTDNDKRVPKNKAVTLTIPGKTSKEAVRYTTTLIWTLTDTPAN